MVWHKGAPIGRSNGSRQQVFCEEKIQRRKRDVVQGKPGAAGAADRRPPEFKDKVLERALDYVRAEIDKQKN